MSQGQQMVTAVAVPMNGGNPNSQQQQTQDKQSFDDFFSSMNMEQNVYEMDGLANDGNWENDTVERSSDLLTNLDAMISAVQTESSALDSMREKLKELDSMKAQLSTLTKRLLEADKANLTLKGNIVKIQEAYTEARKSKQEAESKMVPVHQELNRLKDLYNRERNARLSAQQETTMLKDQLLRLEKINEDMEREVKTIPTLTEQNDIMRTDLNRLRQHFKEEKAQLTHQNANLSQQNQELEGARVEIRNLSVRLLELASGGHQGSHSQNHHSGHNGHNQNNSKRMAPHNAAIQYENQMQQHQQHQQHQQQQSQHSQQMMHQSRSMPQVNENYNNMNMSVNDGRGNHHNDQTFLPATLEEHMLGTNSRNLSPIPRNYYDGESAQINTPHHGQYSNQNAGNASVASHKSQHSINSMQSIHSMTSHHSHNEGTDVNNLMQGSMGSHESLGMRSPGMMEGSGMGAMDDVNLPKI